MVSEEAVVEVPLKLLMDLNRTYTLLKSVCFDEVFPNCLSTELRKYNPNNTRVGVALIEVLVENECTYEDYREFNQEAFNNLFIEYFTQRKDQMKIIKNHAGLDEDQIKCHVLNLIVKTVPQCKENGVKVNYTVFKENSFYYNLIKLNKGAV